MSIEVLSLLMLAITMLLLGIGLPFAYATGLVACGFALVLFGPNALTIVASRTYSFMSEFVLASVPMFILMASLLERSGVAQELFKAVHVWAGGIRGGVGVATMLMAVVVGATIGVIGGEVTLLGIIALPQLLRLGYDRKLSIGMVCAGGALGSMIPPSLILVFFGLAGNVSIGDLLLASVMPGLLMAGLYCAYILVMCNLYPAMGPVAPFAERNMPLLEKLKLLKGLILPVLIIFCVMGSIYAGFASVTESAALGVVGVLFAVWIRGELSIGDALGVAEGDDGDLRQRLLAGVRRQRADRRLQSDGRHRHGAEPHQGPGPGAVHDHRRHDADLGDPRDRSSSGSPSCC